MPLRRFLPKSPWLALLTAASLSPTPAVAGPALALPSIETNPPPTLPADLHLSFALEPAADGARTLVLRDDEDLRMVVGEVQRAWACDTTIHGWEGMPETLVVACGGDAIRAEVDLTRDSDRRAAPPKEVSRITLATSTGTVASIPFDPEGRLWLDSTLVDPTPACDPGGLRHIDVAVDELPPPPGDAYASRKLRVHSDDVAIEADVDGSASERCAQFRGADGNDFVATCWYPHEPHADQQMLSVRDGALLWTTNDISICSGAGYPHGGWRLACDAVIHWPAGSTLPAQDYPYWWPRQAPSYAYGENFIDIAAHW